MADITFNQADARFKHRLNLNYNDKSLSAQWRCECVCKKDNMEVDHIAIALCDWIHPEKDTTVEVVPGRQLPWFASERQEKRGLK